MEITRNDFRKYLEIQVEGRYNMFSKQAIKATGLSEDKYKEIQINYKNYLQKFKGLRDEVEEEFINNL